MGQMKGENRMSTNFIPPQLQDILGPDYIPIVPSGGGNWQQGVPVAPGLYKFTLPDGREILVDENGNIIG